MEDRVDTTKVTQQRDQKPNQSYEVEAAQDDTGSDDSKGNQSYDLEGK